MKLKGVQPTLPPKLFARDIVNAYEMTAIMTMSLMSEPSTSLKASGRLSGGSPDLIGPASCEWNERKSMSIMLKIQLVELKQ